MGGRAAGGDTDKALAGAAGLAQHSRSWAVRVGTYLELCTRTDKPDLKQKDGRTGPAGPNRIDAARIGVRTIKCTIKSRKPPLKDVQTPLVLSEQSEFGTLIHAYFR